MLDILIARDSIAALLEPALEGINVELIAYDDKIESYGRAGKRNQVIVGLSNLSLTPPAQAAVLSSRNFVAQPGTYTFDFGIYATHLWDQYTGIYAIAELIYDTLSGQTLIECVTGPCYFTNFVPIAHDTKARTWEYLLQMQVQRKFSTGA